MTSQSNVALFVGESVANDRIAARSIHVRCMCRQGRREFIHRYSLEELPLARMLYRAGGGKVSVIDGLEDPRYSAYAVQDLTAQDVEMRVEYLMRTYEKRIINKIEHNWFSDTYGKGAGLTILAKMNEIARMFPRSQIEKPRADVIERLVDTIFPHSAANIAGQADMITVPGLDLASAPDVGTDAEEPEPVVDELSPAVGPIVPLVGADVGEEEGDPALINWLLEYGDKPLSQEEAIMVADLVAIKPVESFTKEDMAKIGRDMRSHGKLVDAVGAFYEQAAAAGD